jgi:SAM-dependent methyltransferase
MKLNSIVPWGRSLAEYSTMFMLTDEDLEKSILGCSDGPASFNAELTELGGKVVSVDPVYQFSRDEIAHRIDEVAGEVLSELEKHHDNYIWTQIPSVEALAATRMGAMATFLKDYETGCRQDRYFNASLPQLPFVDGQFDLALCSHFLFLYSDHLGCEFHLAALKELGRVAREIRIYPLVTLDGRPSPHLPKILAELKKQPWQITRQSVDYRFQKGADEMLVIDTTKS